VCVCVLDMHAPTATHATTLSSRSPQQQMPRRACCGVCAHTFFDGQERGSMPHRCQQVHVSIHVRFSAHSPGNGVPSPSAAGRSQHCASAQGLAPQKDEVQSSVMPGDCCLQPWLTTNSWCPAPRGTRREQEPPDTGTSPTSAYPLHGNVPHHHEARAWL